MTDWGVYEPDGDWPHVIPAKDLRDHDVSSGCWCHPHEADGVWVHNSMDLREEFENGRKAS